MARPVMFERAKSTEYIFIDGASLNAHLRTIAEIFFDRIEFEISLDNLPSSYTKIFYYDAVPVRQQDEGEREYEERTGNQREALRRISLTDCVHVYEGDARRRRKRGLEQKMVDVMLAVDMLMHCFKGNTNKFTLLSGDQDFKPVVDALVQEGAFVTLWYPPGETNAELVAAADIRRPISLRDLAGFLTESSRLRFILPTVVNQPPEIDPGTKLYEWDPGDGRRVAIFRDGEDWILTREHDVINRLNIRHRNWKLIVQYSSSEGINIPQEFLDIEKII